MRRQATHSWRDLSQQQRFSINPFCSDGFGRYAEHTGQQQKIPWHYSIISEQTIIKTAVPCWTYAGEETTGRHIRKAKHNKLPFDRIVIIIGVNCARTPEQQPVHITILLLIYAPTLNPNMLVASASSRARMLTERDPIKKTEWAPHSPSIGRIPSAHQCGIRWPCPVRKARWQRWYPLAFHLIYFHHFCIGCVYGLSECNYASSTSATRVY